MPQISHYTQEITPGMAAEYLSHTIANRKLKKRVVNDYARQMKAGRWRNNGQPIIFDTNNKLIDGQHRLTALIKADVTLIMSITTNVPTQHFDTIDTGARRTSGDVLGMDGCPYPTQVAAAIRLIMWYENDVIMIATKQNIPLSNSEIHDYYNENLAIVEVTQDVNAHLKNVNTKTMPRSVAIAAYYLMSRIDANKAREYFELLTVGPVGMFSLLAARFVNDYAARKKIASTEYLALVIKVWNAWLTGKELKRLMVGPSEAFPKLRVLQQQRPITTFI